MQRTNRDQPSANRNQTRGFRECQVLQNVSKINGNTSNVCTNKYAAHRADSHKCLLAELIRYPELKWLVIHTNRLGCKVCTLRVFDRIMRQKINKDT